MFKLLVGGHSTHASLLFSGSPSWRLAVLFAMATSVCGTLDRRATTSLVASEFATCRNYAQSISELNSAWATHEAEGTELAEKRKTCLERIESSAADFSQVAKQAEFKSYRLLENSLIQLQLQAERATNPLLQDRTFNIQEQRSATFARAQAELQTVPLLLQGGLLEQQIKELDAASRIVVQRHFRAIRGLAGIAQEVEAWQEKQRTLADQYWAIADVENVRSRLEHRAGLRELGNAHPENGGATFAKAMMQANLENYAAALGTLTLLKDSQQWSAPALAVQAQIAARQGDDKLAQQRLDEVQRRAKGDPRVRLMRAQTLAILGDLETSKQEWELVLKHGKYEIAARRALALIGASLPSRAPKLTAQALEHAKVASKLSGEEQWSCTIALALAQAACGQTAEAIARAEQAEELAIGEQKRLCSNIASQIQAGQRVVWEF